MLTDLFITHLVRCWFVRMSSAEKISHEPVRKLLGEKSSLKVGNTAPGLVSGSEQRERNLLYCSAECALDIPIFAGSLSLVITVFGDLLVGIGNFAV